MVKESSDDANDYDEDWLDCLRAKELDEAVQMLKERLVVNINVVDDNGNGALHYCCANNFVKGVVFLLRECKMDYCRANKSGNTPLQWAIQTNSLDALKQLLLHDYDIHREEYEKGVSNESEYYRTMAFEKLEEQEQLDHATKLHYGVAEYRPEYAEVNRVNIFTKNAFGKSVLHDAYNVKDQDILIALLEHPVAAVLDEMEEAASASSDERVMVDGLSGVIHTFRFSGLSAEEGGVPQVKARELEIREDEILNAQLAEMDRSGQVIWETDLVAAQWLTALAWDGKFEGKKVLQLGSGCGVSSIAMYVAASVFKKTPANLVLTDVAQGTIDNLKYNIELNRVHLAGNAAIATLDWTKIETWPKMEDGSLDVFDIIIGSDLVYDHNLVAPLTNVIDKLLDTQMGELLYVYKAERQGSELVPEALEKLGFVVQTQAAPNRFLVNPLTSKDEDRVEVFFPDLKTDNFTLLHARRP